MAAAGHWGTGLGFSDLELCAQQLYFPLQAYFFLFIKKKKKAELCTRLVLIFQVEKIGLVHGKYSGDISFICCFNLSLNFWTVLIDFFFFFYSSCWKSPARFSPACKLFPPVLRVAMQVIQECCQPRSWLVRAGTSASAQLGA